MEAVMEQRVIVPPKDIRNTEGIAEYLTVSKREILRLVNRIENPIPHMRISPRVIRFDREKVDEWLTTQENS